MRAAILLTLLPFASTVWGCSAHDGYGPDSGWRTDAVPAVRMRNMGLGSYVKHIVVVIQENRSFDNIFAGYPGADAPSYGYMKNGARLPLRPITFNTLDPNHGWVASLSEWDNGKMDGFANIYADATPLPTAYAYAYLKRSLVSPYWSMAQQYVLADKMFATQFGGSFTAHLDLIAATTALSSTTALADTPDALPWGCDAPAGTTTPTVNASRQMTANGPFPCFTQFGTLADTLDLGGVSWKYYAPALSDFGGQTWSAFDSIKNVREGSDWSTHVITPETTVLSDIAKNALPSVTWVAPSLADSDHAGNNSDTGPSWVASIVNAVGASSEWNSTAVVILWDDWGGWYDNVPPPQLDYLGLGERVPCLVISPYAKRHYVSHTQYEFGSVVKLIEQTFGLPSLGASDARANSLVDAFDFTQKARQFVPITASYSRRQFLNERPSMEVPDKE